MVECTGLENRRGGNSTVGSNPTSSATCRGRVSERQVKRIGLDPAHGVRDLQAGQQFRTFGFPFPCERLASFGGTCFGHGSDPGRRSRGCWETPNGKRDDVCPDIDGTARKGNRIAWPGIAPIECLTKNNRILHQVSRSYASHRILGECRFHLT